jgi:hypothetical protein
MTTIPPKPIMESISPVFPSDLFSSLPGVFFLPMPERSGGKRVIAGTAQAAERKKLRLCISLIF